MNFRDILILDTKLFLAISDKDNMNLKKLTDTKWWYFILTYIPTFILS